MRAIRYRATGSPEVLVLEEAPKPAPSAGEVLVEVHAAGVNPVDTLRRRGLFGAPSFPVVPGADLAGVVEDVGPDVTTFSPGQAVFGTGRETYAEYALAPADSLAPKPSHLTFEEAASIGMGARTAWAAVFGVARLEAGQRILVHGAAGGVGVYAVQLAHWKGAEVIGTCSAANVELVKSLGADSVVDYTVAPFEDVVKDVDVVIDTVGRGLAERSVPALKPGGVLVFITGQPSSEEAARRGIRVARPGPGDTPPEVIRRVADLLEAGALRPVVRKTFPFHEAQQAHELSETGHGSGRIVLQIANA